MAGKARLSGRRLNSRWEWRRRRRLPSSTKPDVNPRMWEWLSQNLLPLISAVASVIAAVAAISATRWQRRQVKAATERRPPRILCEIGSTKVPSLYQLRFRLLPSDEGQARLTGFRVTRPWRARLLLAGEVFVDNELGGPALPPDPPLHAAARTKHLTEPATGMHVWDWEFLFVHCDPSRFSKRPIFADIQFICCWMDRMDRRILIRHRMKLPVTTSSAID